MVMVLERCYHWVLRSLSCRADLESQVGKEAYINEALIISGNSYAVGSLTIQVVAG